ncbi:MAG: hypothetical protein QM747_17140 [Nocardioides sp.]
MKRTTPLVLSLGMTVGLAMLIEAPAHASDVDGYPGKYQGQIIERGYYDDLTDNLCVKTLNGQVARVTISSAGDPSFAVNDYPGGGKTCTGNLAIPEDHSYTMNLTSSSDPGQINGTTTFFS